MGPVASFIMVPANPIRSLWFLWYVRTCVFGEPSTRSTFDKDVWIYIERKITNSHFFGKRDLIVNNVLVLEIDERGVLAKKNFYDIDDMKKIKFDFAYKSCKSN